MGGGHPGAAGHRDWSARAVSRLSHRDVIDVVHALTDDALREAMQAHAVAARRAQREASERQRWAVVMSREIKRRNKGEK